MALSDGLVIKVINTLVYFLNLSSNAYAFAGGHLGSKHTYLSPAPWAYGVWSVIHILLAAFVIYGFTEKGKTLIVDKIQWRFALLGLLSSVYSYFSARQYHIVAFVLSILVSATVTAIYVQVRASHREGALWDEVAVCLPFSLFHAFALVLVVISGFEAFGREIHHHAGVGTKIFVFLALFFLEATATGYAFSSQEGDIAGAAVITYILWAIFDEQREPFIHWSALAFSIIASFWTIKAFVFTWRASGGSPLAILHDEERAPLVG